MTLLASRSSGGREIMTLERGGIRLVPDARGGRPPRVLALSVL